MKNQFLSLIMCMTLSANCMGFYANAETSLDSAERTIIVDLSDENSVKNIHGSNQYIETIELSEGEKVQIVLPDSDDIKYVSFTSYKHKAAVSHDLSLIGYCAGEDEVHVHYVTVSGEWGNFLLNVKVLKSDISDDDRADAGAKANAHAVTLDRTDDTALLHCTLGCRYDATHLRRHAPCLRPVYISRYKGVVRYLDRTAFRYIEAWGFAHFASLCTQYQGRFIASEAKSVA